MLLCVNRRNCTVVILRAVLVIQGYGGWRNGLEGGRFGGWWGGGERSVCVCVCVHCVFVSVRE